MTDTRPVKSARRVRAPGGSARRRGLGALARAAARASAVAVLVAVLVALPRIAHACPSCAAREDSGNGRIVVLGIMIVFPFTIAYVVYRVIRKLDVSRPAELGRLGQQASQEK